MFFHDVFDIYFEAFLNLKNFCHIFKNSPPSAPSYSSSLSFLPSSLLLLLPFPVMPRPSSSPPLLLNLTL